MPTKAVTKFTAPRKKNVNKKGVLLPKKSGKRMSLPKNEK